MKAVVCNSYGPPDVLELAEVERPTPATNEVLIKIHATTVNRTDCGIRAAKPFITRFFFGLRRPNSSILGSELAGEVVQIGSAVRQFAVGDHVFGVRADKFGAHAQFVSMREAGALATMPAAMTFEEAAAVCDGVVLALTGLRRAHLGKGQRILIYGASGSIGTAAVQLAKYFGADVTAVCNTANVETVTSLGADRVLDYTKEEYTDERTPYDVVFDAVGKNSFRRLGGSVRSGGTYLTTDLGFLWQNPVLMLLTRWIGSKRVLMPVPRYTKEDVLYLKELIETGNYRAVIDRRYPLESVVEATEYVETEQKTGNVVLTVSHDHATTDTASGWPAQV